MTFVREHILKRFTRGRGWSRARKEHLKRQPDCQVCGTRRRREVHHIRDVSTYPDLELVPSNLITLCGRDHLVFGHLANWRSINPAVVGDAADWRQKIRERR